MTTLSMLTGDIRLKVIVPSPTYSWNCLFIYLMRSLAIDGQGCFAMLGPNGAGKTTTLSMLTGDIRPTGISFN